MNSTDNQNQNITVDDLIAAVENHGSYMGARFTARNIKSGQKVHVLIEFDDDWLVSIDGIHIYGEGVSIEPWRGRTATPMVYELSVLDETGRGYANVSLCDIQVSEVC